MREKTEFHNKGTKGDVTEPNTTSRPSCLEYGKKTYDIDRSDSTV